MDMIAIYKMEFSAANNPIYTFLAFPLNGIILVVVSSSLAMAPLKGGNGQELAQVGI